MALGSQLPLLNDALKNIQLVYQSDSFAKCRLFRDKTIAGVIHHMSTSLTSCRKMVSGRSWSFNSGGKMRKALLQLVTLSALSMVMTACVSFCRIDGPYQGRVIDAESKQPLAGAVVVGIWTKVQPTIAGATGTVFDSVEVLTDENGEFTIPGHGLLLFSNIDEMIVLIFKAEYTELDRAPWSSYKTRSSREFVRWDDDKAIVPLRKLSDEERRKRVVGMSGLQDDKEKLLRREVNKERSFLGYQLYKEVQ